MVTLAITIIPEFNHVYDFDKIQHISVSISLMLIFSIFLCLDLNKSSAITILIGIAKEITDQIGWTGHSGIFSILDITADLAGIAIAALLITIIESRTGKICFFFYPTKKDKY